MSKYHINSKQEVKPCKADKRKCRFGDDAHSTSEAELYKIIEKENSHNYSSTTVSLTKNQPVELGHKEADTTLRKMKIENNTSETFFSTCQEEADKIAENMYEENQSMRNDISIDEYAALYSYAGNGYAAINETLRGNINEKHKNGIRHANNYRMAEERIALIDNVMKRHGMGTGKPEKTLYRFRAIDKKTNMKKFIQENFSEEQIDEKGYMSASEDLGFVLGHVDSHSQEANYVIFEIKTSKGVSLQEDPAEKPHKLQSLEKERLLPRDIKFRVENVEKRTMKVDETRKNIIIKYFWDVQRQQSKPIEAKQYYVITLTDEDLND